MVHFTMATNKPHDWEDINLHLNLIKLIVLVLFETMILVISDTLECIACYINNNRMCDENTLIIGDEICSGTKLKWIKL